MSIKIYDSYLFKGNLNKTFQLLREMKAEIKKAEEKYLFYEIMKEAVFLLDSEKIFNKKLNLKKEILNKMLLGEKTSIIGYICEKYRINHEKRIVSFSDKESSLESVIYPISNKRTLIIFYFRQKYQRETIEKFVDKKIIEDYHYQNSTDKPDKISSREWNKRLKDWDSTGILDNAPIDRMLSFNLHTYIPDLFLSYELINKNINVRKKDRVDNLRLLLIDKMTYDKLRKRNKDLNEKEFKNYILNNFSVYIDESKKISNSKYFKLKLEKISKNLPQYSMEDFKREIKEMCV